MGALVLAKPEDLDTLTLYRADANELYMRAAGLFADALYEVESRLGPCKHGVYPLAEIEADRFSWFLNTYCYPNRYVDKAIMCLGGWHDIRDAWQTYADGRPLLFPGLDGRPERSEVYCIAYAFHEDGLVFPW